MNHSYCRNTCTYPDALEKLISGICMHMTFSALCGEDLATPQIVYSFDSVDLQFRMSVFKSKCKYVIKLNQTIQFRKVTILDDSHLFVFYYSEIQHLTAAIQIWPCPFSKSAPFSKRFWWYCSELTILYENTWNFFEKRHLEEKNSNIWNCSKMFFFHF